MKVHLYKTTEVLGDVPHGMPYYTVDHCYRTEGALYATQDRLPIETFKYSTIYEDDILELEGAGWSLDRDSCHLDEAKGIRTYQFSINVVFDTSTRKAFEFMETKWELSRKQAEYEHRQAKTELAMVLGAALERIKKVNDMPPLKRIWHFIKGNKV